jgi:FixJ family two-component response regulator
MTNDRTTLAPVLVIVTDRELRKVVGWIVGELELKASLKTNWPETMITTRSRPSLAIVDLDAPGYHPVVGSELAFAMFRHDFGADVPIVVLSRSPDVESYAGQLGALVGIRKPINADLLMNAIETALARQSPG